MMFSRAEKTPLAEWWWSIDRELLGALILLLTCGMVLSFAASPPVAERIGLSPWFFIIRHAMFCAVALPVMIATSFLSHRQARLGAGFRLPGSRSSRPNSSNRPLPCSARGCSRSP
jgi:cell division protein FtsW